MRNLSTMSTLRMVVNHDIKRLKEKGLWIFAAIGILYFFFTYFPLLSCSIAKKINALASEDQDVYFLIFLHNGTFIVMSLFLYFIYHFDIWRRFKANQNQWPWEESQSEWHKLLTKSLKLLFLNMFVIGPVLTIVSKSMVKLNYVRDFENPPSALNFSIQIFICFLGNDFLFHFSHKLLHQPFFYKPIHSVHHQYNNVVGISAEYAHPIEYVFGNVLPATVGPLILHFTNFPGFHIVTIWGFTIFGLGATIEQHSGYDLPFSPYGVFPLTFAASYHDYHHTRAKGNYSSNFIFWDLLSGTNIEYYQVKEKEDGTKERRVKKTKVLKS